MTEVRLAGINKSYPRPGANPQIVLQGLNANIKSGEFVCLLGLSGCGKTTLLNIISGLDHEHQGTAEFCPERPTISYMFQEPRLLPWLSVEDNLRFVVDHAAKESQVQRWLKQVGLEDYGKHYPMQLSLGMQQRVAAARAMILEPELLLMDEPFSSLDELTASRMRVQLLQLWKEQGCTVVFVTHNPLEAVYLADRVLLLSPSPGRIVAEIDVRQLLPRPRDPESRQLWELSRQIVRRLEAFPQHSGGTADDGH